MKGVTRADAAENGITSLADMPGGFAVCEATEPGAETVVEIRALAGIEGAESMSDTVVEILGHGAAEGARRDVETVVEIRGTMRAGFSCAARVASQAGQPLHDEPGHGLVPLIHMQ